VKTVVWTDGSCNANGTHGRGGWAALIEQAGTVREISVAACFAASLNDSMISSS
jgi:ribonuclease HI